MDRGLLFRPLWALWAESVYLFVGGILLPFRGPKARRVQPLAASLWACSKPLIGPPFGFALSSADLSRARRVGVLMQCSRAPSPISRGYVLADKNADRIRGRPHARPIRGGQGPLWGALTRLLEALLDATSRPKRGSRKRRNNDARG